VEQPWPAAKHPLLPNGPSGVSEHWNLHRQIAYPLFFELSYWDGDGNQRCNLDIAVYLWHREPKKIKSEDQRSSWL
jgi:hypothetical protein